MVASEYTWSQDALVEIRIEPKENGLCTEMGPHGFRCDWGRVTALIPGKSIALKWQISPKREPIPDPAKASDLKVAFIDNNGAGTLVLFEHYNFEKNGKEGENYRDMMDSEYGWDYILERFKSYCLKL